MLAVYGQGFCSLHNANHRWVSSLGAIDRPHKTDSALLQKARQPPSSGALLVYPLPFFSPPHALVSLLFSTMHISDQGWMSGSAWELLISGSVLAVSCLSIHTNKGQRSHAMGLTADLSFYLHTSSCLLPLPLLHTHSLSHFSLLSVSLSSCLCLSLWLTFGAA